MIYIIFIYISNFLSIIHLFVACWQDDPNSRPDIQDVEQTLMRMMISGSSKIDQTVDNTSTLSISVINFVIPE